MIRNSAPESSAERQRRFRERNPGYYARLQAKRRASTKRDVELLRAQQLAEHAAALAATTPDVIPTTATVAVSPMTVPTLTITTTLVLPTAAAAEPAFEVVADSPDVFLRIRPASPSDAMAA